MSPTPHGCASSRRRAAARELRAAQADPRAEEPDPVPQGADPGTPARGQPAAQGDGGHRDQARLRRHDILGMSGRAMLDALVAGTTDPEVLAELAKGRLRAKIPALSEALEGRFDHLARALDRRDPRPHRLPRRAIASSHRRSRSRSPLSSKAVELLCTIPGVQRRTAEVIIAETGGT